MKSIVSYVGKAAELALGPLVVGAAGRQSDATMAARLCPPQVNTLPCASCTSWASRHLLNHCVVRSVHTHQRGISCQKHSRGGWLCGVAQNVDPPTKCERDNYRLAVIALFILMAIALVEETAIAIVALRGGALTAPERP